MRKTLFLPICLLILTGAVATSGLPAWPNIDNPAPEGPTAAARLGASVARLKDGRLLISGGAGDNGVPVRTAEIFKDGSTSQAASMFNPRTRHASVTLKDGRVFVTGGSTLSGPTNVTEIYDPATNKWRMTSQMVVPRAGHTMTLLSDGRVLVAGGTDSADTGSSVSIYDPATDQFSLAGQLTVARANHVAGLARGNKVIIAGGNDVSGNAVIYSEIFDPRTGISTPDRPLLLAHRSTSDDQTPWAAVVSWLGFSPSDTARGK